jgi:hypothetical protein
MPSDIFVKESRAKKQFHGKGKPPDPIMIAGIGFFYLKIGKYHAAYFIECSQDDLQRLHSIAYIVLLLE